MEMPHMDPNDRTVEAIAAFVTLAACYATFAYRVWPHRDELRALSVKLLNDVRKRKPKAEDEDPVERRVREECRRRHLQRAEVLMVLLNLGTAGGQVFYLINIFFDSPLLRVPQFVIWGVTFLVVVLAALVPRRFLTKLSVDIYYSFLMLVVVASILTGKVNAISVNEFRESNLTLSLTYGLLNLNPWLNAFWLVMTAGATTIMMVRVGHTCICVWNAYAFVAVLLFGIDYILTRGVRHEILAADSNNERAAVKTLLNGICDVILELDGGLRLLTHSPKLSDVLLQGRGRDLQGADLRDYMPAEDDRAVFAQRLGGADSTAAHADVFHSKLRDGTGGTVDVEFFSVAFQGSDSQRRHLLGMREYTDIQPVVPPQRPPPPFVAPMPREVVDPLDPRWAGTPAGRKEGDLQSHGGTSRSGSQRSKSSRASSRKAALAGTETKDIVKLVTMSYMLMGWSIVPVEGTCCPLHAALAELERTMLVASSKPCNKDFGPVTRWQCRRCGIRAEDYRDPKTKKQCRLCHDISSEDLEGNGAKPTMAL